MPKTKIAWAFLFDTKESICCQTLTETGLYNLFSDDKNRLRENIEALSKIPEGKPLITRYIEKVNNQESRLEQIEKEKQNQETEKQKPENEFAGLISDFQFEENH